MVVELRRSLIVVVMSVIAFGLIYPTVMLLISPGGVLDRRLTAVSYPRTVTLSARR